MKIDLTKEEWEFVYQTFNIIYKYCEGIPTEFKVVRKIDMPKVGLFLEKLGSEWIDDE